MKTFEEKSLKPLVPLGGRDLWAEGSLARKRCLRNDRLPVWVRLIPWGGDAAPSAWAHRPSVFKRTAAAPAQGPRQAQDIWLEGLLQADIHYRLVLRT